MASVRTKKRCVKCDNPDNNNGIFTCNGCANTFCGPHVKDHREELNSELESVVQEHDSIQQQLAESSGQQTLLQKIDRWEKKSISKIQKIAETARRDLQKLVSNSEESVSGSCREIAKNLRAARKTENFSEIDLQEWTEQLSQLKLALDVATSCSIVDERLPVIYSIKVQEQKPVRSSNAVIETESMPDRFGETLGPVTLDSSSTCGTYSGSNYIYGRLRGAREYSQGRSTVYFKIEQSHSPDQLFFGIMASNAKLDQRAWSGPSTLGWCGKNDVWQHGSCRELSFRSIDHHFQVGDILQLLIDCDHQSIQLCQERTETSYAFEVDTAVVPFPWQFVVGLRSNGDCVSII